MLQDYLLWRLGVYQCQAPQPWHLLPFTLAIVDGAIVMTSTPETESDRQAPPQEESMDQEAMTATLARIMSLLNEAQGAMMGWELHLHVQELQRLTDRLVQTRQTLDAHLHAQQEEIAAGVAPRTRASRRHGRPHSPGPWGPMACGLAIAATVLVEAWQFALPYLNATGVDTTNLAQEWRRNCLGILAGGGFAFSASAGIFILWHGAWQAAVASFRRVTAVPWWQTACRGAFAMTLSTLLIATAVGIGWLRGDASQAASALMGALQRQGAAEHRSAGVFVLLTVMVPFAAAYLQHKSSESAVWQERQRAHEAQAQWDAAVHQAWSVRERWSALLRMSQTECRHLERQCAATRQHIRDLADQVCASEKNHRARLEAEHRAGRDYGQRLLKALQQDRYYFLKTTSPGWGITRMCAWLGRHGPHQPCVVHNGQQLHSHEVSRGQQ
jgi:hypothetical protein